MGIDDKQLQLIEAPEINFSKPVLRAIYRILQPEPKPQRGSRFGTRNDPEIRHGRRYGRESRSVRQPNYIVDGSGMRRVPQVRQCPPERWLIAIGGQHDNWLTAHRLRRCPYPYLATEQKRQDEWVQAYHQWLRSAPMYNDSS